jgi:hypothetical protein
MIAQKRKGETQKEWQDFLSATNGSLQVSRHLRERYKERFPDSPELSDNEILDLVRQAKPLYSYTYTDSNLSGMVVRKEKMIFAICFDLKKVMTIFPYSKKKLRTMNFHQKNTSHLKKSAYKRSSSQNEARHLISEY